MKHYSKQCNNTKQVNAYLKRLGLGGFEFDADYTFPVEFDYDGWLDSEEQNGVSVQVHPDYEVFVVKYTKNDIEQLNSALDN